MSNLQLLTRQNPIRTVYWSRSIDLPPDNNTLERAMHNVKAKHEISGKFKTEAAAQNFLKTLSIDTTIKKQHERLGSIDPYL
ncbi:MAG: hypothetical protein COC08_09400 [Maribacter sp.]|nr:MAG: hypothetical protein COC08_09400 [Maribacter sp.]